MAPKITLFSLFFCFTAVAQVSPTLVTNLSDGNQYDGMSDMAFYNNTMYISNSDAGNIIRVDVSSPNAVPELFIDELSLPTGMAVVGNDLYFLQAANTFFAPNSGTLSKVSLVTPGATPVLVASNLRYPTELEISNTNAYIVESVLDGSFDLDHTELALVNFSGTPTKTILYNNFYSLDDLELNGNDLYLLEWKESTDATSILKLDITNSTPGTPVLFYEDSEGYYPYKMEINDNKLYFNRDDDTDATVYALDLSMINPVAVAVASPFEFQGDGVYVGEMIVNADILYDFASAEELTTTNYLLFEADLTALGIDSPRLPEPAMYPNPCTDLLTIDRLKSQIAYSLFNASSGKKIAANWTSMAGTIDISALSSGVYFLSLEGFKTVKIIKR
jgi:hypothetical protein